MQLTVKQVRDALAEMDGTLPLFFRRVSSICGNIEEAGSIRLDTYGSWGKSLPCVIIEPMQNEEENEGNEETRS